MTDAAPTPFTMIGDQAAAVCVDGVCEIPSGATKA
ncbi:MAG: hypothetical protein QOD27_1557 [Microbacteriaceae bacterium]|jgi:hypothetical protein|nr:hypothetical protein [Microbacteriaceae bacterium]MDQ1554767.1 hypothetical protein [Microbacteriaceae bacterium]